jgi:hypothetical protein
MLLAEGGRDNLQPIGDFVQPTLKGCDAALGAQSLLFCSQEMEDLPRRTTAG